MTRLYLTPLPEQTTDSASGQTGSQVQQAGLLDTSGTSVENIATENVDFRKQGRIQLGPTLSRKVADELDSLSESAYTSLPLFDPSGSLGRKSGYYEVARADVTPAQEARDDVYQYDINLTLAGTREDSRRAVRTNPQEVNNPYSNIGRAQVLIPAAATDVRWFDTASGTEPATSVETVETEFGAVALYDIEDASFDSPTLTYDLPFNADGPTDVRVFDTQDRTKMSPTASGGEVNIWPHVYHTGYQFDGAAVIDTGRLRLVLGGNLHSGLGANDVTVESGETITVKSGEIRVDRALTVESGGTFTVESGGEHILTEGSLPEQFAAASYDVDAEVWVPVNLIEDSPWTLASWSLERVRPARVEVRTRWVDGTEEAILRGAIVRGAGEIIWIVPEGEVTPPQTLLDLLEPISIPNNRIATASQGLVSRSKRG